MQVRDFGAPGQKVRRTVDLAQQEVKIIGNRGIGFDDLGITAALPAELRAKRHMDVERNRLGKICLAQPSVNRWSINTRMKMRSGGVTRVTRNPRIEMGQP